MISWLRTCISSPDLQKGGLRGGSRVLLREGDQNLSKWLRFSSFIAPWFGEKYFQIFPIGRGRGVWGGVFPFLGFWELGGIGVENNFLLLLLTFIKFEPLIFI